MKKIVTLNRLNGLFISLLLLVGIWGCRKESLVYQTTTDTNITSYLEKYPEQFSEFRKILEITGNASYLNAYGAYTLFAPTNDAVKVYLTSLGKTSVDQVDISVLKDMVRFHLLSDTIKSNQFTDGKLPSLTMFGQYLITGAKNVGGVTSVVINRQANIIQADIKLANGYIHSIDHVLIPAKYSVAQLIENNPKFSIFSQALKATGLYDTLNILPADNPITSRKFLTILAESDSVLKVAGINDYAALKAKLCKTGDPKNTADSLYLFMAYHIIFDAKYLADIATSQSQTTLAPLEVLSTSLQGTTNLINDITFMGVHEPGAQIDRTSSDNSASNGVQHNVLQHYILKVRKPVRVDWDVCDQPELRKMTSVFRKTDSPYYTVTTASAGFPFADITWALSKTAFGCTYKYSTSSSDLSLYHDFLMLDIGGPSRPMWWEFRTPLIPRGKYKVWVGYKYNRQSSGSTCVNQVLIDGFPLPRFVEFTTRRPAGQDGDLEAQNWKQYTATTEAIASNLPNWGARCVGVVDIQTTDRHIFRLQSISGSMQSNYLDFVQFIPINDDQIYPRFYPDGTLLQRP